MAAQAAGADAVAPVERIGWMKSFASFVGAARPKKQWQLIVLGLLYGLLTPFALFTAFVSLFAFDTPGSERDLTIWFLALSAWMLPVTLAFSCVGCLLCAFLRPSPHQERAAGAFTWLPLLNGLVWAISFGLGSLLADLCPACLQW